MQLSTIVAILSIVTTLVSCTVAIRTKFNKVSDRVDKTVAGQRCLLRSDMLRIYYHNREAEKIRQYEYENFVKLYNAYKALGGNSFIDKIYEEIKTWEVIT